MDFHTVNYLFAAYLQTKEGGLHKIARVERIRPGKAKFFFNLTNGHAEELQLRFHNSLCSEFEQIRKQTIDLCFAALFGLYYFSEVVNFYG